MMKHKYIYIYILNFTRLICYYSYNTRGISWSDALLPIT